MHIFGSFETRAHPERRLSRITATEPELMASLSLRVNPGNKSQLIEPYPNSEPVPKSFRKFTFDRSRPFWIRWDDPLIFLLMADSLRPISDIQQL